MFTDASSSNGAASKRVPAASVAATCKQRSSEEISSNFGWDGLAVDRWSK